MTLHTLTFVLPTHPEAQHALTGLPLGPLTSPLYLCSLYENKVSYQAVWRCEAPVNGPLSIGGPSQSPSPDWGHLSSRSSSFPFPSPPVHRRAEEVEPANVSNRSHMYEAFILLFPLLYSFVQSKQSHVATAHGKPKHITSCASYVFPGMVWKNSKG